MDKPHVVVFDVETRKLAQDLGCAETPCAHDRRSCGWDALKRGEGGLSVIALWDSFDGRMYLYDMNTMEGLAHHLESADIVVGFNSMEFDVKPIEGIINRKLRLKEHVDLLQLIWTSLRQRGARLKGNTLDDVSKRTIGRGKSGDGLHAPQLADEGRWAELFQYCMDDVDLTRELLQYIMDNGGVIGPDGRFLPLPLPASLVPAKTKD
jgi:DEAD/DEAH box helicase domain-containing protein